VLDRMGLLAQDADEAAERAGDLPLAFDFVVEDSTAAAAARRGASSGLGASAAQQQQQQQQAPPPQPHFGGASSVFSTGKGDKPMSGSEIMGGGGQGAASSSSSSSSPLDDARARAFVRSSGARPSNAGDRAPVYADTQHRKWRELLWATTALVDSTTVTLFAAAAADTLPAAAASDRPVAVDAPAPAEKKKAGRLGPLAGAAAAEDDAAGGAGSGGSDAGSSDDGGGLPKGLLSFLRAAGRVFRLLRSVVVLVLVAVASRLAPVFLAVSGATGLTALAGLVWYAWEGIAQQLRPYEPAAAAQVWAAARDAGAGAAASHKLPLTLDEAVGAAAVDPRTAPRVGKVLLELLAPRIAASELEGLAGAAVNPTSSFVGPATLLLPGKVGALGASSALRPLSQSGLGASHLRKTLPPEPRTSSASTRRTLVHLCRSAADLGTIRRAVVGLPFLVAGDVLHALGLAKIRAVARTIWLAVTVAAGYGAGGGSRSRSGGGGGGAGSSAVPDDFSASAAAGATADRARSESGAILRRAFRGALVRSPEMDTADVLRDVRAVAASADLLVTLVLAALRGEDHRLRQVAATVPVVVYSLSACLVACATYASSPRYSATVAWATPLSWRGTDADSIAVAEVEAALTTLSRVGGRTGGGKSGGASAAGGGGGAPVVPPLQVNLHLPGGESAADHVPRSARPALATLQAGAFLPSFGPDGTGDRDVFVPRAPPLTLSTLSRSPTPSPPPPAALLRALVRLHAPAPTPQAEIHGMAEYMAQLAESAPSMPIKAVLMLAARKAAAEAEEVGR
jgi:hypothetical protein